MAAFSGAPGPGGLDIVMQGRGEAVGRCSRQRLDMDESLSLEAHVWRGKLEMEAACTVLINLITLLRLSTYISNAWMTTHHLLSVTLSDQVENFEKTSF